MNLVVEKIFPRKAVSMDKSFLSLMIEKDYFFIYRKPETWIKAVFKFIKIWYIVLLAKPRMVQRTAEKLLPIPASVNITDMIFLEDS